MSDYVILGRIGGPHGVRGWVKILSHTAPRENIFDYAPWYLGRGDARQAWQLRRGRPQGKGLVALLEGVDDRDQAGALQGMEIAVPRDRLPMADDEEYYWTDLEGLRVKTLEGVELGQVDHLFATGSNDVMVIQGQQRLLVPLIFDQVVKEIDLQRGEMRVDWDPDY